MDYDDNNRRKPSSDVQPDAPAATPEPERQAATWKTPGLTWKTAGLTWGGATAAEPAPAEDAD